MKRGVSSSQSQFEGREDIEDKTGLSGVGNAIDVFVEDW